jgi:hypothetical protein
MYLQENVGRNGAFPAGIQVLTIIDYTDVALIRRCYLELAVCVARHTDYRRPLLEHLLERKCYRHWDETVRELAADALQRLVKFDAEYVKMKVCIGSFIFTNECV